MKQSKGQRIVENINNYLFDHRNLKNAISYSKTFIYGVISAFIFALGFSCFITPASNAVGDAAFKIATGGVSGISQVLTKVISLVSGQEPDALVIEAIGYSCFNLPLVIFAFFFIGKKFAIFTAINVGLSSLFLWMCSSFHLADGIAQTSFIQNNIIARIIFGGAAIGVSSAIAFKGEISCGGIDIVTYYMSLRKSTSVGKYSLIINSIVVSTYAILVVVGNPGEWYKGLLSLCISIAYLFVVNIVVDAINLRNKKIRLEIITSNAKLPDILMSHFPHGATLIDAKGAYSLQDKLIIYMVVSSFEVKKVTTFARKVDPHAFISVSPLTQVYGNFFIKPIE